jgi:hypothetical protein
MAMDAFEANEAERVRAWRLNHGSVFLVMVCLSLLVAVFVIFDGWDVVKAVRNTADPTVTPQGETAAH